MDVLHKLASIQGRRDEQPNQDLALELIHDDDREGIRLIAENLHNKNKKIQNDCIKVLYEIGYIKPELIADYVADFIQLLHTKNNRLTWGCMIALSTIGRLKPKDIFRKLDELKFVIEKGSVITIDAGVKTLALVASTDTTYRTEIFPWLINHLQTCRPKEVPMHGEFIAEAVDGTTREIFLQEIEKRKVSLTDTQMKRVNKLIKKVKNA
ncbi:MAG: hypothetical protein H6696_20825 [Deferribacteres bacterium]|nr:hypothetical protein [candidate division KSB1 bacterium]MCB9504377.1 hypothetical protein [Deferribacteres bacterium]